MEAQEGVILMQSKAATTAQSSTLAGRTFWFPQYSKAMGIADGVTLAQLLAAISDSWGLDTTGCTPGLYMRYKDVNPWLGQCEATALVTHDYVGGMLMEAMVKLEKPELHTFNMVDGTKVDFTRMQFIRAPFPQGIELCGSIRVERDEILGRSHAYDRYMRLRGKVDDVLVKMLRR